MNKTLVSFVALIASAFTQKVFNVMDYGAKGDGKTLDTDSIREAIKDLDKN